MNSPPHRGFFWFVKILCLSFVLYVILSHIHTPRSLISLVVWIDYPIARGEKSPPQLVLSLRIESQYSDFSPTKPFLKKFSKKPWSQKSSRPLATRPPPRVNPLSPLGHRFPKRPQSQPHCERDCFHIFTGAAEDIHPPSMYKS